jgi:hypothetical protein
MSLANTHANPVYRLLRFRWALFVLLTVAAFIPSIIVNAQERDEKVEIFRATQGSYQVVVQILPSVPVVGPINFTVTPTFAETGEAVRDAEIRLIAHDADGTPTYQVRALNTPVVQEEYIGNISINSSGFWQIHIEMTTEEFGEEVFVAQLSIAPVALGTNPEGAILMLIVIAAFVLGGGWIWLSSRRALARRDRIRATV